MLDSSKDNLKVDAMKRIINVGYILELLVFMSPIPEGMREIPEFQQGTKAGADACWVQIHQPFTAV